MAESKNTPRSILSREQAARNGDLHALPDKLKPMQIAALEYPDDPDSGNSRFQFCNALQKAIDRGELNTSGQTREIYGTYPPTVVQRPLISRADFRRFLELIDADPSPGVSAWLAGAGTGRDPAQDSDGRESSKLEQRIEAIRTAIDALGYCVSNLPYGGVDRLKSQLEKSHPGLFNSRSFNPGCSFDKAWKAYRDRLESPKS